MEELTKASKKLNNLSDKKLQTVKSLAKNIVNKLLHGPMSQLRASEDLEKNLAVLKTLKAVFELQNILGCVFYFSGKGQGKGAACLRAVRQREGWGS